ncbi:MAG: TolC family protein, partial [Candidatus Nealsonbacteria bacterium]|nr:TolC family protein [Candidatus Nealsonbacteria bacterium]
IPGFNNGVMIARINTDMALADFEAGVRNLVSDVEIAYWELYYSYRFLDAMKAGRDSGLQTWRETYAKQKVGHEDGDRHDEARARQQYFLFRNAMERAQSDLFAAESKLRYMMGLAATDGRLIRPGDEPSIAKVAFDWHETLAEGLARSVELRKQQWVVKQRQLELIAAKNYLLPRLDGVGRYRWLGLGDDLLQSTGGTGNPAAIGSNAYQSMTSGQFQEWHFGIDLSFPLGFRKEMAGVRHAQLNLARERARLQEQELELSHQLSYVIRDLEAARVLAGTNFNRLAAAKAEADTAEILVKAGEGGDPLSGGKQWTLDALLDAQRRLAEAEADFYRSVVDYNKSIAQVHYIRGSLLEYNGVMLREGPWPGKAYFDANRRARKRDASVYLNYGYTRPKVISRGPYNQHAGQMPMETTFDASEPTSEMIPAPAPEPAVHPGGPVPPEPPLPRPEPAGDVGTMDLGSLDDAEPPRLSSPAKRPQPIDAAVSAVSNASFEEPIAPMPGNAADRTPSRTDGDPSATKKWTRSTRADTGNELLTNPSALETDRSASGWKRLQR